MQMGSDLNRQWQARTITYTTVSHWQWEILQRFWNGTLQRRLEELQDRRSAVPSCRRRRL